MSIRPLVCTFSRSAETTSAGARWTNLSFESLLYVARRQRGVGLHSDLVDHLDPGEAAEDRAVHRAGDPAFETSLHLGFRPEGAHGGDGALGAVQQSVGLGVFE